MGYYVEVPNQRHKVEQIVRLYGGVEVTEAEAGKAIHDNTKAVVVVADNGPFEAAAYAYDYSEFKRFTDPRDPRDKWFIVMPRELVKLLTGFKGN